MRERWRAVLALVTLLVAGGFAVSAARAESSPQAFSDRLVQLINQARSQNGLHTLTVTSGTSTVAANWTEHLDRAQALSHNPNLGPELESHGSPNWTIYGENVGEGPTSSADTLFQAYMNSPEHRDNILGSKFRFLGVGVVFDGSTAWNTLDFVDQYGTTTAHTARPPAQPKPTAKPVVKPKPVVRWISRPVVAAPVARPARPRTVAPQRHRPVSRPSVEALTLPAPPVQPAPALTTRALAVPIHVPHPERAPLPVLVATAAVIAGVAARYLVEVRAITVSPRVA